MKKALSICLILLLLLALPACGKYVNSYSAVGFVHSNSAKSAFMSFLSFKGRMVFRLSSSAEGDITYSASLESGHATVYYDSHGSKLELFSIEGGQQLDSHGGYIESGTVYIIVETDGSCTNGDFKFSIGK